MPIRRGMLTLGALLFARAEGRYDSDDVQVATLLASGVAAALENSRLYQALADERSTLAAVLGSTQDAVLMVNEEGAVVLANPAVRSMLGLAPEGVTGQPISVVGHEPLRQLLQEAGRAPRSCRCPTAAPRRRAAFRSPPSSASRSVSPRCCATSRCGRTSRR